MPTYSRQKVIVERNIHICLFLVGHKMDRDVAKFQDSEVGKQWIFRKHDIIIKISIGIKIQAGEYVIHSHIEHITPSCKNIGFIKFLCLALFCTH